MPVPAPRAALAIVLVIVAAASWFARDVHHQRVPAPDGESWVTTDPDSHYQFRRVDRALRDGGSVASHDPYLRYPEGSAIPWPPYYAAIVGTMLAPFAPEDEVAQRGWIEMRVASLPLLFGVITSLLAALAGWWLAGTSGALLAGLYHALSNASIAYSRSGNGDHHAWITMLAGAGLLLSSLALGRGTLDRPRDGFLWGAAIGALAGTALGSWVASVLYVIPVQILLAWLAVQPGRAPRPGLPAFGLGFHLTAFVVLTPAVLASPWRETHPWNVVNLTWFHPVWLALGGLVFVLLFFLRSTRARRLVLVAVAAVLAVVGVYVVTGDAGFTRGIREGFEWLSRSDEFMGAVWESRGLVGAEAVYDPFDVFGYGLLLLPIVWAGAARLSFGRGRLELLPWVIAGPLLAAQAARQFRFADALSLPLAVLVGWGIVAGLRSPRARGWLRPAHALRRLPPVVVGALVFAGVTLTQWDFTSRTIENLTQERGPMGQVERPAALAMRGMCNWLRANSPPNPEYSVLASWIWGHTIEWVADRPTVATNFGSFLGDDAFRAPARFFLTEDPAEARLILEDHRAHYVLATTDLSGAVPSLSRSLGTDRANRYFRRGADSVELRPEWFRTLGARLLSDSYVFDFGGDRGRPLDFLRLVHVSPQRDPRLPVRTEPSPVGWIWERVPGAAVEATGPPGQELTVQLEVRYPDYRLIWRDRVAAGADGVARMRVPYATVHPNGDGRVETASWRFGNREGPLHISIPEVFGVGVVRIADTHP